MSEQQPPWERPGWEGIHLTEEEISLDETGRVIINNPDLAKVLRELKDTQDRAPLGHVNFSLLCGWDPDWKCRPPKKSKSV